MRKLVIAVVVLLLVVVVLVVALPFFINVNQYRGQIQAELQNRLNRPVQLGNMSLSLVPLAVKVDNVTIGDDPNFHSNVPFAQVQQLDVHVGLFALLGKKIEVSSLTLEKPKIELIRNAAGVWNFSTLGHNAVPAAPAPQAPAQPAAPGKPAPATEQGGGFQLSKLSIADGLVA